MPRHLKKKASLAEAFFIVLFCCRTAVSCPGRREIGGKVWYTFPKTEAVTGKFCVTQTLSRSRESRKTGRFFSIWYLRTKGKEA